MDYQIHQPHADLASLVKCYWTLEVPAGAAQRQRIIPDGCIEMFFMLGDDVGRYTSDDEFIIQPRAMVLGPITKPFYIKPTGCVKTFAVRFYPYGFANFVSAPIRDLADKETPLALLFGKEIAKQLEKKITEAADTKARINIIENLLVERLHDQKAIDRLVKTTIDTMFLTSGKSTIQEALKNHISKRRQLERKFTKQIGVSPKQLSKMIRLQTALKMMLKQRPDSLTKIAYNNGYYDQAHFTKDFKEFTGMTPKEFFEDEKMALASLFYK